MRFEWWKATFIYRMRTFFEPGERTLTDEDMPVGTENYAQFAERILLARETRRREAVNKTLDKLDGSPK